MILWEKIALIGGILLFCGLLILFDDYFKPIQLTAISVTKPISANNRNSVASISDFFQKVKRVFSSGDSLSESDKKKLNDELAFYQAENARLKRQLIRVGEISELPPLVPLPTRVILYDPIGASQILTLNVGENDGVKEGMVVCSGNAIVGKVYKTSGSVCLAITCRHRLFKIPIRLVGKQSKGSSKIQEIVRGIAEGIGSSMDLKFISVDSSVSVGDIVLSSNEADYIPPGFLLGTVKKAVRNSSRRLWEISVAPTSSSLELDSLYIPLNFGKAPKMHIPREIR